MSFHAASLRAVARMGTRWYLSLQRHIVRATALRLAAARCDGLFRVERDGSLRAGAIAGQATPLTVQSATNCAPGRVSFGVKLIFAADDD